jgi:hypothetical protein
MRGTWILSVAALAQEMAAAKVDGLAREAWLDLEGCDVR